METLSVIKDMKNSPVPKGPRMNVISALMFATPFAIGLGTSLLLTTPVGMIVGTIFGLIAAMAPRVANQWERAVVLRLGRYTGLRGPGLFWVLPLIDRIPTYIDQRIITTNFAAEQTLT